MTDKLREAEREAFEAWASETSGFCSHEVELCWAAWQARATMAQQDAQAVPTQRQYELALGQWDQWKSYALELQAKLVKYEGGSPMVLNAAPTPPEQRVMLTDEEIEQASVKGDGTHSGFARAVIEAYERKNGIK